MRQAKGFFDSDGVRLHYLDWGGSGSPLVLLAGMGGTAHIYGGLAPRLAERFRVAALTRRGHGRSDRPHSGYDLDTLVEDIRRFLDLRGIERATLAGHSWAGLEIPRFATKYPGRVEAVVYLDALHVFLEPRPDFAADPVMPLLDTEPRPEDLASPAAYLGYYRRARPDMASIWCAAIEAHRRADMTIVDGRPLDDGHGTKVAALMNAGLGPHRDPAYGGVAASALALVPDGATHPFLPPDAPPETVEASNAFYAQQVLPWLRRRTALFRQQVPTARVVELDTSNHHVFIAREDETVAAVLDFLG